MFTQTQGLELMNNTIRTWTTLNGVNGGKFTSKIDSSKYIFLPAGGFWQGTSLDYKGIAFYSWATTRYNNYYPNHMYSASNLLSIGFSTQRATAESVRAIQ